jgi:hypothetical protein
MDLRYQSAKLPTNAPITRLPGEEAPNPNLGVPAACYPPERDFLVRSQERHDEIIRCYDEFRRLRETPLNQPVTNRFNAKWAAPKPVEI